MNTCEPETLNASAPYVPINTLLSENTSKIGKPEMLLTENSEPDKLSVTVNNLPTEPSTENIVEPEPDTER